MKDFDYIIIGGGCSGLSLAFELNKNNQLIDKTLAIIEKRSSYYRDRTWSFWRVKQHNFEDCVIKNWRNFTVNNSKETRSFTNTKFPYQSINSELFYKKIIKTLKKNNNIKFYKNIDEININGAIIFNSVFDHNIQKQNKLWQHFHGVEIEVDNNTFDETTFNLMDFDCDQKNSVHFFYTLPFTAKKALIETTWLSEMKDESEKKYKEQINDYITKKYKINNFTINYSEEGAIPLFFPPINKTSNIINIGSAGGMTRLSTGYTFLNIQEQSKHISKNLSNIKKAKKYQIPIKYKILDKIFLRVLKKYPYKMNNIFLKIFKAPITMVIKFLSNTSNIMEDLIVIIKMPKITFIKEIFK